jgi:hypothetical protein
MDRLLTKTTVFKLPASCNPVTISLTWDKPNHQFVVNWTNRVTHVQTGTTMLDSLPDATVATDPTKVLTVNSFPANCAANATWVYIEATFDNVRAN